MDTLCSSTGRSQRYPFQGKRVGQGRSVATILKEPRESDCGLAGNWPEEPPNPKVCKRMHAAEKSDTGVVPKKEPNEARSNRWR